MERIAFLVEATGERIDCLLNPETFEVKRLAGVRQRATAGGQLVGAGLADDPLLFTGGGRTEITLDLLFDVALAERGGDDVRHLTLRLWKLAENSAEERSGVRPPLVRLVWGKTWNVPGVVVAVAERFDDIDPTGVPRRCWLRMKLVRVAESAAAAISSFEEGLVGRPGDPLVAEVAPGTAVSAVGDGDGDEEFSGVRMDLMSASTLGDPLQWRTLAEHNDIDNPLTVPAGTVLTAPTSPGGSA